MKDTTKLFGYNTKKDWIAIRSELRTDFNNVDTWEKVTALFKERLESRYFRPINRILKMRLTSGEGFSAMTLICSLIEFLESCYQGKNFNYNIKKETDFEYKASGPIFKDFLMSHEPFKSDFSKKAIKPPAKTFADDFYSNVRCGLLHEAATKNGWIIKTYRKDLSGLRYFRIKDDQKIIYRDLFFEEIQKYVKTYLRNIKNNNTDDIIKLRKNLCRKIDSLAEIKDDADWWNKN